MLTCSWATRRPRRGASGRLSALLAPAGAGGAVAAALVGVALLAPSHLFDAGALVYRSLVFLIGGVFPTILLFGGLNRWSATALVFITPCYTLGFLIGGAWAPFLTVAMVGLGVIFAAYRAPARLREVRR